MLELPNGTLLATARFQTDHFVNEKQDTGAVSNATAVGYKNTVITRSTDGGRTYSEPVLVTGLGQQTGALVRYGTFQLNFHHFNRIELGLRGYTHVRDADLSCLP